MEHREQKNLNKDSLRGTVYVLLSAICFSTGGVLIKLLPWSSMTIQGLRSIFAIPIIGGFMLLRRQRFVWNKTVLFGAVLNTVMAFSFVAATKMTTAANAIVIQYMAPIYVLIWDCIYRKTAPKKKQCLIVLMAFAGMVLFFGYKW